MNLPTPRPLATLIARVINDYVHQDVARLWPTIDYYPGFNQLDVRIEIIMAQWDIDHPVTGTNIPTLITPEGD